MPDPLRPSFSAPLLALLLFSLLLGAGGCGEVELADPRPDLLNSLFLWDESSIAGHTMQLYGSTERPTTRVSTVYLYFPNQLPGDPNEAAFDLGFHLLEGQPDPDYAAPIESIPNGLVIAGPVEPHLSFHPNSYLFSAAIIPFSAGLWMLETRWHDGRIDETGWFSFQVDPGSPRTLVPFGSWPALGAFGWRDSTPTAPGPQPVRISAWRAEQGAQNFAPDSSLRISLLLMPVEEGELPDTFDVVREGYDYLATIELPERSSWTLRAIGLRDSVVVGSSTFTFSQDDSEDSNDLSIDQASPSLPPPSPPHTPDLSAEVN